MTKENIIEVITKLIGEINPVADAAIDYERLENLKLFTDVFIKMYVMIEDIAYRNEDTPYGSVKPFVELCNELLGSLKEHIE